MEGAITSAERIAQMPLNALLILVVLGLVYYHLSEKKRWEAREDAMRKTNEVKEESMRCSTEKLTERAIAAIENVNSAMESLTDYLKLAADERLQELLRGVKSKAK